MFLLLRSPLVLNLSCSRNKKKRPYVYFDMLISTSIEKPGVNFYGLLNEHTLLKLNRMQFPKYKSGNQVHQNLAGSLAVEQAHLIVEEQSAKWANEEVQ